jgi:hypothetical protein
MKRTLGICAMALGLMGLWPTIQLGAANPHVFRFQATWVVNPDGTCGVPHSTLFLGSTAADGDVVDFTYQFTPDPCTTTLQIVPGVGQVEISGNQAHLRVQGTISTSDERPVQIDLTLRKSRNLPDPGPGEKLWSATARGTVILDGTDLTGGQPSTTAQIRRSPS